MCGALLLTVVKSYQLNTMFQRVELTGEGLQRIPEKCAGLHIKLFFMRNNQAESTMMDYLNDQLIPPDPSQKPTARSYSIRYYDRVNNLLSIDFVLHKDPGVACDWAKKSVPGSKIGFFGPGPKVLYRQSADNFLLIGDASAIPALMALIDQIDIGALINVVLELEEGCIPFIDCQRKRNIQWHWLVQKFNPQTTVLPLVKKLSLDFRKTSVTLAGEHKTVVCLRQYFRTENIDQKSLYAVPYWSHQQDEDSYRVKRHRAMNE